MALTRAQSHHPSIAQDDEDMEKQTKAAKESLHHVNASTQDFLSDVFKALDLNNDGTVEIDEMITFFMKGEYVTITGNTLQRDFCVDLLCAHR